MQKEIAVPVIIEAVRKAGNLFLQDYKNNTIPTDKTDLLRQLETIDERCLKLLEDEINPYYPEIPFLGEEFDFEGQASAINTDDYWLCDFMDGAIQYLQHINGWTINLVLIRNGQPYFSVIFDPIAKEMFWAMLGNGAFMNGKSIKPSIKKDSSIMVAVFEYGHQENGIKALHLKTGAAVTRLLDHFGVVRNYGPHGLQLAYVGAGRIDVFYQEGQDAYNWLAGMLIAKEAGADVLTTDGKQWTWGDDSLLVTSPGTANLLFETIADQQNDPS
ncbi:inositol monophosphatase family protein [Pedobacter jeongneungensis]|uniref:inositol monophosphatase family protein n=1 Tax=Pedobacter jeongneungensis TaxID=947309 RepID=UPI0004686419|nr:inositol monophosphatase family protein [Pedobacter jeongneungensis]